MSCMYLHGTTALFQGRQLLVVPGDLLLGSRHCGLKPVHIGLHRYHRLDALLLLQPQCAVTNISHDGKMKHVLP